MFASPHEPEQLPPHAPKVGRIRRLLGDYHVTGVFWYRFHRFGVSILPSWGLTVVAVLFTTFFFLVLVNIRRGIAANLEVVLGPCGFFRRQLRIFRTMWEFACCLSGRYESLSTVRRIAFDVDGLEVWDRLLASGQGFILVTAHVGNWEVGSLLPGSQYARRIHVIREREMDPKAQMFISQLIRERVGHLIEVHFVGDEDPGLGAELLSALRRGEVVALQGDRPRAHSRSVTVQLFGQPLALPAGPAALARAASVPLVPVFIFREGRLRSRVVFQQPIEVAATGDREHDISEAVGKIAVVLEDAIRERPHQWFCFRELWPKR